MKPSSPVIVGRFADVELSTVDQSMLEAALREQIRTEVPPGAEEFACPVWMPDASGLVYADDVVLFQWRTWVRRVPKFAVEDGAWRALLAYCKETEATPPERAKVKKRPWRELWASYCDDTRRGLLDRCPVDASDVVIALDRRGHLFVFGGSREVPTRVSSVLRAALSGVLGREVPAVEWAPCLSPEVIDLLAVWARADREVFGARLRIHAEGPVRLADERGQVEVRGRDEGLLDSELKVEDVQRTVTRAEFRLAADDYVRCAWKLGGWAWPVVRGDKAAYGVEAVLFELLYAWDTLVGLHVLALREIVEKTPGNKDWGERLAVVESWEVSRA